MAVSWLFLLELASYVVIFLPLMQPGSESLQGQIQGGPGGPGPLTTKNEAPAPKFYKIEAPKWQF